MAAESDRNLHRIGPLVLVAAAIAMLPSFANGNAVAYGVFAIALTLAFVPAAILARKTSLSTIPDRKTGFGVAAIVGGVLILSSVDVPPLQTGVLGMLVGVILAAAIFVPRSSRRL